MPALTDLSDLLRRITGDSNGNPEHLWPFKVAKLSGGVGAPASPVANRYSSLWQYSGNPGHGSAPGAASIPDRTTGGALAQANPSGGRQKWLVGMTGAMFTAGTLILYDRLLHSGNLSGTVATQQTVGGVLTRNTGGLDNQIWLEIYTQIGTTGVTVTAAYTNQAGVGGRTTKPVSFGATGLREAQRIVPLPLADGDNGVQSVESVTLSGTTGTAGAFGVTLANPIAILPVTLSGVATIRDFTVGLPGPIAIDDDACLAWAILTNPTSVPEFHASLHFVEK